MFKAQKDSKDIVKVVHVTSVFQPSFYEATRIIFVCKEKKRWSEDEQNDRIFIFGWTIPLSLLTFNVMCKNQMKKRTSNQVKKNIYKNLPNCIMSNVLFKVYWNGKQLF